MTGNSIGKKLVITTWGGSHGPAIGVVIDGVPPCIRITEEIIQKELDKRKPGQSDITTQRKEDDKVEILSGVLNGITTGTPISIIIKNKNADSSKYDAGQRIVYPVLLSGTD